ncbi:Dfp1/Him1, central region-domain-containing protein [Lipomyces oligophaga]|uniref:Dfp1/Him1, central region-domain-containing protein n=1 Tax=Lipomyces oligophaga TaxID=45792 RepID=UPI0034CFF9C0
MSDTEHHLANRFHVVSDLLSRASLPASGVNNDVNSGSTSPSHDHENSASNGYSRAHGNGSAPALTSASVSAAAVSQRLYFGRSRSAANSGSVGLADSTSSSYSVLARRHEDDATNILANQRVRTASTASANNVYAVVPPSRVVAVSRTRESDVNRQPRVPLSRARDRERDRDREREHETAAANHERDPESLLLWQKQWRRVLTASTFYFDAIEDPSKDRIKKQLVHLGSAIETFFHGGVSHVITNRPLTEQYPPADIITQAKQRSMKLWTYEKLCRFLANVTDVSIQTLVFGERQTQDHRSVVPLPNTAPMDMSNNLTRMLREEKLKGPADSDPRARRDDVYYFKGPYIHIRDSSGVYRSVMVREYSKPTEANTGDWPQFQPSGQYKCPFLPDHSFLRRHKNSAYESANEELRHRLELGVKCKRTRADQEQVVTSRGETKSRRVEQHTGGWKTGDGAGDDRESVHGGVRTGTAMTPVRMTSARANAVPGKTNGTPKRVLAIPKSQSAKKSNVQVQKQIHDHAQGHLQGQELIATGINMSNITSNVKSMTQSGGQANGLGASTSQIQSKEVTSLKKKIFERKRKPIAVAAVAVKREEVAVQAVRPGYCENCRDRFDDYEDHLQSRKHRKFACNQENFAEIDELLARIG